MNHIHRIVWNRSLRCWQVTHEHARAHGKAPRTRRRGRFLGSLALAAAVALLPLRALALPTAPQVIHGSAAFTQGGGNLTVTNSANAIINWQSFSIGQNETTRFIQPNAASAVLNRVLGSDPSQILGQLQSNGRVFLVNPAGILVGPGARIDVGGLVASTLNLANADFLAGRLNFTATPTAQGVVNQGSIATGAGGTVILTGPQVDNQGLIATPQGQTVLAAGQTVHIQELGAPGLSVAITGNTSRATNLGRIVADAGQIGVVGALVKNSGSLSTRSVVQEGGRIFLKASQSIELAETSKIAADGSTGGQVSAVVSADGQIAGQLTARGEISAQGNGQPGSGGDVDTSAANLRIDDRFRVNTGGGRWLIDPADYTIAASGGNISGATLSANLGSNSITILSSAGTAGGNGDIKVNDAVSWSTNTLTLTAARDIEINAVMTASGTSSLVMNPGTANGSDGAVGGGTVRVGLNGSGFIGRVDFPGRSGTGFLTIGGQAYTVLNSLGAAGSTTGTDLQGMAGNLAGYYALGSDIDASATSTWNNGARFAPVGSWGSRFTGTLDGLGHSVGNLVIYRPATGYVGLFGVLGAGGTVTNLGVIGGSVLGNGDVGGLAGDNYGTISNSYSTGAVTGSSYDVGGLVGTNSGTVSNSYSTGAVTGSSYDVGGLVGTNSGTVSNSYSTGAVSGSSYVGGLVGYNSYSGTVSNSHYDIDAVTINGGHYVTEDGLYSVQYADWIADKALSSAASYFGAPVNGYYQLGSLQNMKDLLGFAGETGNKFQLTADIDLAAAPGLYVPRLAATEFDGAGHVLANLTVIQPFNSSLGLFGEIGSGSTVRNLGVVNVVVSGSSYVGGLVGRNSGTVSNSYSTGAVSGSSDDIGGLVGYNSYSATISNSYSTGAVTGSSYVGGLVGSNSGTISNSYSTGPVSGWDTIGGLVGDNSGTISNSYSTGAVSGSSYVGGLVGDNSGTVSNSHYDIDMVNINGGHYVTEGGLYGAQYADWITNKTLNADHYFGAPVGGFYQLGSLQNMKDLLGFANEPGNKFQLMADIDLSAAPGLYIPRLAATEFDGAGHVIVNLTVNQPFNDSLGLFGDVSSGSTVRNLGVVNVAVTGSYGVGGLVGNNRGAVSNSYSTGTVSGSDTVGGLVGNNLGAVSDSYSTGTVTGSDIVGGLVGNNRGTVSNSYSTGTVSGSDTVGGLVGWNYRGTVGASYWNIETSGQATSAGGTGLTSAQMRDPANFVGWDFANTWAIDAGTSYPYLRSSNSGLLFAWDGGGSGGLWSNALNWVGDVLPASGSRVSIGSGYTITYDLTGLSLFSLSSQSPIAFASGKTLTLTHAGAFDAPLTLGAGSQLNALGTLALAASPTLATGAKVNLAQSGSGILTIGGQAYTVLNSLGAAGSTTGTDLQGMAGNLSGRYALGSDIDASATSTWNSGAGFAPVGSFTGTLDGLGHSVGNLVINRPDANNVGLFSALDSGGTITNLGVVNGSVTGSEYVGGLVGTSIGTISDSYSTVTVAGASHVGGLIGAIWYGGTLNRSYSTGPVSGSEDIGGLVGWSSGTLNNSHYNIDAVTINGGHYVTEGALYGAQYADWIAAKTLNPNTYFGAPVNGYYQLGSLQNMKDFLGFAGETGNKFQLTSNIDLAAAPGLFVRRLGATEFDGAGHVIANLAVNQPFNGELGLFGSVGTGSTVKNLGVVNVSVTGGYRVGGLIGDNEGAVLNSYSTGTIAGTGAGLGVGGLVGWNTTNGTVSNSYSTGAVTGGDNSVGGLVGVNEGTVSASYSAGAVTGPGEVGGLVGSNWGTVSASYSTGAVTGSSYDVGGLVGHNSGTVSNSYSAGAVTGTRNVGGLMGYNFGTVSNSHYDIDTVSINGGHYVTEGGLYGAQYADWIATKTLDPDTYFGPPVNGYYQLASLQNMKELLGFASVTGKKFQLAADIDLAPLPGFHIPRLAATEFDGAGHVVANLTVNQPFNGELGLFGVVQSGSAVRSLGAMNVAVSSSNFSVGGLVGYNYGTISNSFSTGAVSGYQEVGGLVGHNKGILSNSYSTATVSGIALDVGGLVGKNKGAISNSYSTGAVSGGSMYYGGLVGWNDPAVGTITNSYWNTETSGQATSGGGIGLTSAQMRYPANFVGWDFASTWAIDAGTSFPYLRSGPLFTWDGGGSGALWSNALNWVGDVLPASGSRVRIGSGYTITYDLTGLSLLSLSSQSPITFASGRTLTIGTGTFDAPLTLGAGSQLNALGTLALAASPTLATGAKVNLALSGNGILTIGGQAYTVINSLGAAGSTTGTDLQGMTGNLSGRYALGSDIDASATSTWNSGAGFAPVGASGNPFTGTLDGLGHSVGNLVINRPATDFVGLFGYLGSGGTLTNLGVVNVAVSGSMYAGGLVGNSSGTVSDSYSTGVVSGRDSVGGLMGFNDSGFIRNSYSTGAVSGSWNVGGLVGFNNSLDSSTLSNSHYDIDAVTINGGHLVTVGGLYSSQYADWIANKTLHADHYFGAPVAGYYQLGSVQNLKDLLGFAGGSDNKFRLTADIDLASAPGFHVPHLAAMEFDGAGHTLANLTVNQPFNSVLGLFGRADSGSTISNLGLVNVAVSGATYVGGLVGHNSGTIRNSYSTGTISGVHVVGGLVSSNSGTISNSYSTGAVSGSILCGGLVGGNSGTIRNSYSGGAVTGRGLVGLNTGTVSNSYWNIETSGQTTSAGGTGLTSAQMRDPANFVGWDFANTWAIDAGTSFPYLRSGPLFTWDGGGSGGLWSNALNWVGDVLPASGSRVSIGSGYTITYDLTGLSLLSLSSQSPITFASGKTLTIGTGTFDAPLTLGAGSQLNALGTLALAASPTLATGAKVNLAQSGNGILTIGGQAYTVLNSLGAPGSTSGTDLQGMAGNLAGRYALGSDVDASATASWNSGAGFAPVGSSGTPFTGTLDGLGHSVGNLVINRPTTDNVGLFGYLGSGGTLTNLGVVNGSVSGNWTVGGLAGANYGTISNSYNNGIVAAADGNAGGLVGENWGAVKNSYSAGSVSGNSGFFYGGLVGTNGGSIDDSFSSAAVSGNDRVGGLVGQSLGGSMRNSHYDIDAVTINGGHYVTEGGLYSVQYADWIADKSLNSAASYFGAPVNGYYQLGSLQNMKDLLGFAGESGNKFKLVADIDLATAPGLYIPRLAATEFDGAGHVIANLAVNQPFNLQIGLFGVVDAGSTVKNIGVVNVSVSGSGSVGGLVGENLGSISNSYSSGSVSSDPLSMSEVGGLVGYSGGAISRSYSTATVSGGVDAGGLVGWLGTDGTISHSYSSGAVSGSVNVGGLASLSQGTITASYWNTETSGQSTSAGGTGLTTAQMQNLSSFGGWDMAAQGGSGATWRIYEGATAPLLRVFLTPLTLTADGSTRTYDATAFSGGTYSPSATPLAGQILGSAVYGGTAQGAIHAGAYTLTLGGLYSTQQGHDLTYRDGILTIAPRPLGVSLANVSKTYDGNTTVATLPAATFTNALGGDLANLALATGAGTFSDKNVASGKSVSYTGLTLGGTAAGDYSLGATAASGSGDITPASLSLSGVTAQSKTYDGTTAAALSSGSLGGLIPGDSVTVAAGTARFADRNVGTGKTVTASGYGLSGADAGNYVLTGQPGSLSADIAPANLSINGVTAQNKTYDGNVAATLTAGSLGGLVLGDSVTLVAGSGSFADRNAGIGKPVTASGYGLSGADAGNYVLTGQPASLSADITPASLTVTGLTALGKVYDGNTVATLSGGSLTGVLPGDAVGIAAGGGRFADKNVGNAKPVTVSAYALTGADAGNYVLAGQPAGLSADITPASLSLSGVAAQNKTYDGTTAAALSSGSLGGLIAGDSVTVAAGTAHFADRNVGTGKTVTVTAYGLTGADAGNYVLTGQPGALSADIAPASLSINGVTAQNKTYDGNVAATLGGGSLGGLVPGDSVTLVVGSGSFADRHVGTGKAVATSGYGLSGADAGNYVLAGQPAGLTANILQLARVNWVGTGSTGDFYAAANWAGGAIPDGNNVAAIVFPSGLHYTSSTPILLGNTAVSSTGDVVLDVTGGFSSGAGAIVVSGGGFDLTVHSPIAIGSGGIAASNGVRLSATTADSASTLSLDGPISAASGSVALAAYGNISQNANISAPAVAVTSSHGNITLTRTATTSAASISYAAPAGTLAYARNNFSGATPTLSAATLVDTTFLAEETPATQAVISSTTTSLESALANALPAGSGSLDSPVSTSTSGEGSGLLSPLIPPLLVTGPGLSNSPTSTLAGGTIGGGAGEFGGRASAGEAGPDAENSPSTASGKSKDEDQSSQKSRTHQARPPQCS